MNNDHCICQFGSSEKYTGLDVQVIYWEMYLQGKKVKIAGGYRESCQNKMPDACEAEMGRRKVERVLNCSVA